MESKEIQDFGKALEAFLTPGDLKDTMASYLPAFLQRLHSTKKLCTIEKHPENVTKVIRNAVVNIVKTRTVEVLKMLKAIILVRHVDRSIREKSIRAVKHLLKICPAIHAQLSETKLPVFVIFILEREFRSSAVVNERTQCFKLMSAWLTLCSDEFPLLFAQSILSLVRNEEELQLRFKAIDLLILMCSKAPRVAAQVGGFKQLIESVIDPSLDGYRYDRISHALMLLINDPRIRIYFRPVVDLNKIFAIFTRPDGVKKDPHQSVLDKI